ncbi:unnamed protein product, partial [Allacma fusca]
IYPVVPCKNLLLENQRNIQSSTDEEQLPNLSTREQLAENPFLRDYFESQAELYHSQKVVKKLYEGMAHTPDEQQPAAAPVVEDTKEQRQPSPEPQVPQAQPELEKPSEPAPAPYTKALRSKATPVVAESEPVEPETPTVKESKVPPAKVVPELVVASKSKPPKIEEYEAKKDEQPSRPRRGEQPSKPSKVDTAAKPSTVEATKPPKVEEVSKPPKDETVAKPPKIEAVAKPPKVEAVAKPPKVETVAKPPKVEAVAKPPKVEEPTKPLKIEEPSKPLKVEEPSKSLKIEEPSKPLKVDEAVKPPVIEEAAIPPVVEEAAIPLKIEEAAIPPKIEEAAIPPKIEEPSKAPQVEEPSKAPQVEEVAKPPIVEETAKPLKVDEAAKPLIVGDVAITPKVEEPPTAPKVQEPPPLKVQEPVNHVKDEPSKLPVVEERVEPPKVEEKLKSPIVEKVQKPEVPSKVETEPPLKKECKPQAVEEPQKTLVEEKLEPTESSHDAGAVEDKLVKELPTPEPEPQKADKGLKPVKKLISEEESEKLSVNPTKDQRDEPSVDKETVPNELPQSKDDKEEEESEKATDEDEDEEESRVEEEEEPEKPPVQKTLQSSPRRPMEEVLDYGDEESNDKKEEETTTWKRRVLKRNFQPDIINEAKSGSVVSDSAKVVSSPKSPSENPDKIKAAVVRSEQMDVDEVLDYGEEESDIKKDEFIWTRRILRLKNRCSVVDKTEKKWNRGDRKPVVVTSKVLEAFFPDVKPLPEAEVRLEERIPKEPEEPKESKVEAASENVDAAAIGGTLPNIKRKISIIPFEETVKELTPPRNPLTNILVITNLTRPFTLMQLKELLQRTGTIEDIWVDKIKSKCLAKVSFYK